MVPCQRIVEKRNEIGWMFTTPTERGGQIKGEEGGGGETLNCIIELGNCYFKSNNP